MPIPIVSNHLEKRSSSEQCSVRGLGFRIQNKVLGKCLEFGVYGFGVGIYGFGKLACLSGFKVWSQGRCNKSVKRDEWVNVWLTKVVGVKCRNQRFTLWDLGRRV